MNIKDIYWVAGLIEGEGSFVIMDYSPTIRIAMTDIDVLDRARKIMNISSNLYRTVKAGRYNNTKDYYLFQICGSKAIQWMMTLYILMGNRRRERIKDILTWWKDHKSNGNSTICKHGHLRTASNTYIRTNGSKVCRICLRNIKRFGRVA